MNILVLSRNESLYSTQRLKKECEKLHHTVRVLDPLKYVLFIHHRHPKILVNGSELKGADVVLPRVGNYALTYCLAVLRQFELLGTPLVNHPSAIARVRNKLECLQLLSREGIPVPETLISRYPRHLQKFLEFVRGTPVIMKLLKGTQGTGVILSESVQSMESVLDTIWSLGEDIMLQRYVQEAKGEDLRVLVIDGKVRAAMRRRARQGEFRANIHRGGKGEAVRLSPAVEKLAIQATRVVGLNLAGVDILEAKEGPLVIEINASPGFHGLEKATRLNVAKMIVEYTLSCARKRKKKKKLD